jgi:nijmegen breakage syndrome protein 1
VVLSFSFTAKELRNNPLKSLHQRLDRLDIKLAVDFIRGSTTHVVAKKRNTSKGLQALINGAYIVDFRFIDAITAAAEQSIEGSSALEADFDANWPDALEFLPPRGKEPTQRSHDAYFPNLQRHNIFDGYTFLFYDQAQFDNLLAPLTNGRGKALLYQAVPNSTTFEDFVRYVKGVAGEKGLGEFEDGGEGKGVVVVRYQPAQGPTFAWYSDFITRISLQLDHRLIEQNEFLDAILNNDASVLRKPLEIELSGTVAPSGHAGMDILVALVGFC